MGRFTTGLLLLGLGAIATQEQSATQVSASTERRSELAPSPANTERRQVKAKVKQILASEEGQEANPFKGTDFEELGAYLQKPGNVPPFPLEMVRDGAETMLVSEKAELMMVISSSPDGDAPYSFKIKFLQEEEITGETKIGTETVEELFNKITDEQASFFRGC